MTNAQSDWLDRLLKLPGREDFTNEEIDDLFRRQSWPNATREHTWQLRDARNRLSELVRRVRGGETHLITVRGEPAAMLVPVEADRTRWSPSKSLAEVLLSAPRVLSDEEADRVFDREPGLTINTPQGATDDA